ncbi:MAG: hypothetical protein NTZ29_16780 [Verrucomicrobia bacterium]|nr:hypothetical protein [Verrucomicrobiota bacterium]
MSTEEKMRVELSLEGAELGVFDGGVEAEAVELGGLVLAVVAQAEIEARPNEEQRRGQGERVDEEKHLVVARGYVVE